MAEFGRFYKADDVTCPYNRTHVLERHRLQGHLVKCKKSHSHVIKQICPFNATHHVDSAELSHHISDCPDRRTLENYKYTVGESGLATDLLPVENREIPCEENWDDSNDATYDPSQKLQDGKLLLQLKCATPSERKKFREARREMFLAQNGNEYDASIFGDDEDDDEDGDEDNGDKCPAVSKMCETSATHSGDNEAGATMCAPSTSGTNPAYKTASNYPGNIHRKPQPRGEANFPPNESFSGSFPIDHPPQETEYITNGSCARKPCDNVATGNPWHKRTANDMQRRNYVDNEAPTCSNMIAQCGNGNQNVTGKQDGAHCSGVISDNWWRAPVKKYQPPVSMSPGLDKTDYEWPSISANAEYTKKEETRDDVPLGRGWRKQQLLANRSVGRWGKSGSFEQMASHWNNVTNVETSSETSEAAMFPAFNEVSRHKKNRIAANLGPFPMQAASAVTTPANVERYFPENGSDASAENDSDALCYSLSSKIQIQSPDQRKSPTLPGIGRGLHLFAN